MKTISHSEKMFLAHIISLAKAKGYCYASNRYFRDFSDYSERQVERILKHLGELKMLEVRKVDGLRLLIPLVGLPDKLSAPTTGYDQPPDILSALPDNLATIESKERTKKEKSSAPTRRTESEPILYNFSDSLWYGITDAQVALWQEAYPAVDVELELRQMGEWCKAAGGSDLSVDVRSSKKRGRRTTDTGKRESSYR